MAESGPAAEQKKQPHLGVPKAEFIEDVAAYLAKQGADVDLANVMQSLDELYRKYKMMELSVLQKKRRLLNQIPEIEANLEIIEQLKEGEDTDRTLTTDFKLADNLFVKAKVPQPKEIGLWLGANVMLEYSLDDAHALLEKNLSTANSNLQEIEADIGFIKDNITTTEVNMARLYNWDVRQRREAAAAHAKAGGGSSESSK